jgi:hypothetical protein
MVRWMISSELHSSLRAGNRDFGGCSPGPVTRRFGCTPDWSRRREGPQWRRLRHSVAVVVFTVALLERLGDRPALERTT